MTLRTKTSLLLASLLIVILGIAGIYSLHFLENSLRNSIYAGLESVSAAESQAISKFLEDTLRDAQAIASYLPQKALEEKKVAVIEEHLKKAVKNYPKFENGMFLLDAKGTLWADYPVYPETRGKNFAHREYFKTTMEKQKGIIGIPYRSTRTGEAVLTFTALLRGSNNQVLGLLGCSVQLLHPNALGGIRKTKIGESGYIYVFDTSRLMILHPEDQRVLQRDVPPGANKLLDAAIEGFEGVGETVNSRGVGMLLSLKRVPETNWIIGAQQSKREAFAPIQGARNRIIWGTVAVVLIAVPIGMVAVRRLTEPLSRLRNIATQLGQNAETIGDDLQRKRDLQEGLKSIQSTDEIGDLTRAFKEMYEMLDQTLISLKGLARDWERTFDSVHDAIYLLDKDNRILRLNQSAARLMGVKVEEAVGQLCYKLMHGTDRPHELCPHVETLSNGKPKRVEIEEPFLKGFFEITTAPLLDKSGHTIGSVHVTRDITERKQAEAALLESAKKYRSLVDNANDAIFIVQDGFVKFQNPSALALSGFSEEEYAVTPFSNLVHPEDREMVLERYIKRMRGEEVPSPYSFRIFNRRGEELWVQLNAVLIEWEGRPAVLSFIRDITSQKRLEAQIQQAQKMEAVGTLAGGVAHDFNNLLQTVLGYTEILLMDNQIKATAQHDLQQIKRAAERGAELTQQLLTFSRKVQSKLRSIDLNKEVIQVEKLLKRTIPKMIEVELHLADDLRTVNADPVQVEQILMNLAVNSRDAMPEGGRLIIETENMILDETFCKNHLGAKPGRYVALTVSDTGHGMDGETLKHIYNPFFTTKGVGKGTGLGLAMVYGIVKSHEGYILCESEPNKGATFRLYFPVSEQGRVWEELIEDKGIIGGSETILIVDDEESIRNLGEQIFRSHGYTVLQAPDGESARKLYQEKNGEIDLVVLDLIMPGMGGEKCLEGLLQINPDVKVVIASGYSLDGSHKSFLEGGAKNFIGKPFNAKEMLQAVREVLDEEKTDTEPKNLLYEPRK
ncbi:MAG: PAS domain S-box protein [Deltaproteobacteria bacterium]|nr:PAS domain S-box protein [Deltaproteobacteria bacterium]